MPEPLAFHLGRGDAAPVQQSPVSCGSASLIVARMLVNRQFAQWIADGIDPAGGPPDTRSQAARFAEEERQVMNRTNGLRAEGGRLNIPWPRALGTPPWGARTELECGASRPAAAYAMRLVRLASSDALRQVYRDLAHHVREGLPALLYVGNAWMPRHVTLLLPGGDDEPGGGAGSGLDVYDPATGSVTELVPERFASRSLGIAGWNVPWITVQPR